MIKKVVITGPESSGKSTLALQLATALNTIWVPEYARQYIDKLDRPYEESDLLAIAKGQLALEDAALKNANHFLIIDTDLITIEIWGKYKFGRCDDFILKTITHRPYDFYLLTDPTIPWEYDPQRENPDNRDELYELYKTTLKAYRKNFVEISGNKAERLSAALDFVKGKKGNMRHPEF